MICASGGDDNGVENEAVSLEILEEFKTSPIGDICSSSSLLLPSRLKLEETVICLKPNEVLSLEEDEPIKSLEETSEVQSDSSGQDHDKFRKVAGGVKKEEKSKQGSSDVKPKPSKKPKKTKTEIKLAKVSNQLNLKKINACFKPLLSGEIKEDIQKHQCRPEAFSLEILRHSQEGEFVRLNERPLLPICTSQPQPSKQQGSRRHDSFRGQKGCDWIEGNNSSNVTGDLIGREISQGTEGTNEGGVL